MTKYEGHAREEVAKYSHVHVFMIISGDGMLHEVVNGLADRVNRDPKEVRRLLSTVSFALVPSGTSNGLASSINSSDPAKAIHAIVHGSGHPSDLLEISQILSNRFLWDFHAISWGFTSDCDAWMENHRWMPRGLRTYVAVLWGIIKFKNFKGEFSFLPHPDHISSRDGKCPYADMSNFSDDPQRKGWKQLIGRFVMITCINVPRASSDIIFAPGASFFDGGLDVMIVTEHLTRWEMIKIFLALETGSHVHYKCVKMVKAKEVVIDPLENGSHLDASGQKMSYEKTHVKVIQGGGLFLY